MTSDVPDSALVATINGYQATKPTILVASDDASVLMYTSIMLKDSGRFNVLMAASGGEAIQQAEEFGHDIKVLLADFQMKGMTGIELATKLTVARPGIKVLLMSDFPAGKLVLNEGWHFMPKPFVSSQLCALITSIAEPDKISRFAQ